jgi:hypothetical protein
MVAHMNQPLFSHSNWLVVSAKNIQNTCKDRQLLTGGKKNKYWEETTCRMGRGAVEGVGGWGGGVDYRMTLYNVRIYETSYCLHHARILLFCMDGWTKVISGEPGHRSPYLSHAKRALYHLS